MLRIPGFRFLPFVLLVYLKIARSLSRRVIRRLGFRPARPAAATPRLVPRTVWMFWDSGEASAPQMVRMCIDSWRARNPGWDVRVLDRQSVEGAVDMPPLPGDIPVQAYADLLRLRLLRRFGGVWADATTYCVTPLDHWLPPLAQSGFFAFVWTDRDRWFTWPGVYRALGNWFLASEPEGAVISAWESAGFAYWEGRRRAHVYYWPHVLIEYLCLFSRRFRADYAAMPQLSCYGPHLVHDCVVRGRPEEGVRALLVNGVAPVQKLRWNWSEAQIAQAMSLLPEVGAVSGKTAEAGRRG